MCQSGQYPKSRIAGDRCSSLPAVVAGVAVLDSIVDGLAVVAPGTVLTRVAAVVEGNKVVAGVTVARTANKRGLSCQAQASCRPRHEC